MESKTEDFAVQIEAGDIPTPQLRSFQLFEEYSKKDIIEIMRTSRARFEKADLSCRRQLEVDANNEITDFCKWLKETKQFPPILAHYYSISLKSLLLGLPIGVQIAQVFNIMLASYCEQ